MFPSLRARHEGMQVREIIDCDDEGDSDHESLKPVVRLTVHAYERIKSRGLRTDDVVTDIAHGVVVEDYCDLRPYPTRLLLIRSGERPLHVVVSERPAQGVILVVTAYEPSPELWYPGFRRRR
jgi:hypothetical protein